MTEDQARAVLLLQAVEQSPDAGALWTDEDRIWATRAARQGLAADAGQASFVAERARLAMQRLLPRDAGLKQALGPRAGALRSPLWPLAALAVGILSGLASDALTAGPYFNLLSPLLWGLLAWNVALYLVLALTSLRQRPAGPLRRALAGAAQRRLRRLAEHGPLADFAGRWASASLPLASQRIGATLHALAAGLALGLIAGLMLRGLVFDYRAGWASTLLQPESLRSLLAWGLAPAHALTAIAAPDAAAFDALRVLPGRPADASAAPWIMLLSTQLALLVVLPRALLLGLSVARARSLSTRFPLTLEGRYFDQLRPLTPPQGVWVLPHAQLPEPQAAQGLRSLLGQVWGDTLQVQLAPPVAYGDEDAPPPAPPGHRVILLADLAATPEADTHGRLAQALVAAAGRPPLLIVDDSGFVSRFGHGSRHRERIAAWQSMARACDVPLVVATLEAPDTAAGAAALRRALDEA